VSSSPWWVWFFIAVTVIGLLVASFFIFKYIRRRNTPERIRARCVGSLAKINVSCIFLCFRCERSCFRRPKVRPRQEVNRAEQLNTTSDPEPMVSRSDSYIVVHTIGGPVYEELDHSSTPPVLPYDVPCFPFFVVKGLYLVIEQAAQTRSKQCGAVERHPIFVSPRIYGLRKQWLHRCAFESRANLCKCRARSQLCATSWTGQYSIIIL
jgi:hypothetical protein